MSKTLYLRGKACQLAVLTFNNSPITHLVALKCGSVRELVISVTLNSVGKPRPALTGRLGGNEQHPAIPQVTWRRNTQFREQIYYSLISRKIFDEQKRRRKSTRGTEELLYIDQHILKESKTRRKYLAMAWIDYKKAYDMVPQNWILHCLKMYKILDQIVQFIKKTMQT